MDSVFLLVSCIIHQLLRSHCALMSDCCERFPRPKSQTGTVNPEHIPSPRTIHPFLQPTLSARGGGKETFSWYYRRRLPVGVSLLHNRCFMRLLSWSQRQGEEWEGVCTSINPHSHSQSRPDDPPVWIVPFSRGQFREL